MADLVAQRQKLSIVHVNTHDMAGGAAKVAWRLMEEQRKNGHDANILCGYKETDSPYSFSFDLKKNVEKRKTYVERGLLYYEYEGSQELIHHPLVKTADILHFHNLHGDYFNPMSVALLSQFKPTIWTLHDMQAFTGHCAHSFGCDRWKSGCGYCPDLNISPEVKQDNTALLWQNKQKIYSNSRLNPVCPSMWLKTKAEQSILNTFKINLIYNGVNTEIFTPLNKKELRRKYKVPENLLVIGAVAHGGPINNQWKGGLHTHQAMEALWEKYPGAVFLNIGGKCQVGNRRIINVGPIADENKLCELYNLLDVFLYTSLADNCPLVVLEALAAGVPIVCFATGGVPELVRHNEVGLVAGYRNQQELEQHLLTLCQFSELRSQFGQNAVVRIKSSFDHRIVAKQYEGLYLSSIDRFYKENVEAKNLGTVNKNILQVSYVDSRQDNGVHISQKGMLACDNIN